MHNEKSMTKELEALNKLKERIKRTPTRHRLVFRNRKVMKDTKATINQKLTDTYYYFYNKYLLNVICFDDWEKIKDQIRNLRQGLTLFMEKKNEQK